MNPDSTKTRVLSPSVSIEVGQASWDPAETSVRRRVDGDTGRFSPHSSSELPLGDLQPLMEVVAENDLIDPAACAAIIEALAASVRRRV